MKRNHVLIAFLLFLLLIPKSVSDSIFAFINDALNNKIDVYDINWIIYNADLLLVPFAVWFGAIFPDFDLRPIQLHRKLLHNIFALMLPTIIILFVFTAFNRFYNGLLVAGAFSLGCFTHIATDCITPHGTYVLWPVSKKFRIRGSISTGSWKEAAVMILVVVLLVVCLAVKYFPH
jgi:membrane-bound metal-dependent hydrolase YbcI (DUF457 family)